MKTIYVFNPRKVIRVCRCCGEEFETVSRRARFCKKNECQLYRKRKNNAHRINKRARMKGLGR